jgi:GTP cyclohydrolase IA
MGRRQFGELVYLDRASRSEAEAAVRTLIRWAGDDPSRPGLIDTPARVARAYEEWFRGYGDDPEALLERTFDEIGGYDGPVELRDIPLQSFCEHHMAAIQGRVHIAYLPVDRGVGISKLVRLVEAFARRLQIQERLTGEIAATIDKVLRPRGVAPAWSLNTCWALTETMRIFVANFFHHSGCDWDCPIAVSLTRRSITVARRQEIVEAPLHLKSSCHQRSHS